MKKNAFIAFILVLLISSELLYADLPRFELVNYPPGPLVSQGFQGTADSQSALDPELIWDGQLIRMYYTAVDNHGTKRIALALSSDLLTWRSAGVVLEPGPGQFDRDGVSAPDIIQENGVYHLYYTAENAGWKQIARISSTDGMNFSGPRTIVLTPSFADGSFDFVGVSDSSTVYQNGLYQMVYRGHDGTPWWKIGLAYSQDGIHFNRILGTTGSGSIFGKGPHGFDDGGAEDPEIWAGNDNDIRMLYTSLHY